MQVRKQRRTGWYSSQFVLSACVAAGLVVAGLNELGGSGRVAGWVSRLLAIAPPDAPITEQSPPQAASVDQGGIADEPLAGDGEAALAPTGQFEPEIPADDAFAGEAIAGADEPAASGGIAEALPSEENPFEPPTAPLASRGGIEAEANAAPEAPSTPRARVRRDFFELAAGDPEAAAIPPPAVDKATLDLPQIEALVAEGKSLEAHRALSEIYWKQPAERARIQQSLDDLSKSIYFSPQPHIQEPYVIQPGDQLRKIAGKYRLSWQYLAQLNRIDPKKIRPGKKLKVIDGPFAAAVDLSDYELTVTCGGGFVRKYRVGIGKDGTSPIGEFVVKEKLEDPTYYGPDGDVKAHDDPQNPLGERWIDIGDSFGIHGTIEPDSIGHSRSRGCIRMLNADVEELYDLLTIGSPVKIQR